MRDNSVAYTLQGPGGVIVWDPRDTASNIWVQDCDWNAAIGPQTVNRPGTHGSYMDPGYRGGGVWNAQLRITGGDSRLEMTRTRLVTVLNSLLGDEGTGTLSWTNQGATTPLQLSGVQVLDETAKIDGGTLLWHVQLATEKPFAEDATATVVDSAALTAGGGGFVVPTTVPVTLTASSGGTVAVTNNGDGKAYPVLRIYGPITAPRIGNTTLGKTLAWTGSIAAGDYVDVDLFQRTVKLNGVTSFTSLDVANSDWFYVGRGATTLQLSGSSYTASTFLRAFMKSAWW